VLLIHSIQTGRVVAAAVAVAAVENNHNNNKDDVVKGHLLPPSCREQQQQQLHLLEKDQTGCTTLLSSSVIHLPLETATLLKIEQPVLPVKHVHGLTLHIVSMNNVVER